MLLCNCVMRSRPGRLPSWFKQKIVLRFHFVKNDFFWTVVVNIIRIAALLRQELLVFDHHL